MRNEDNCEENSSSSSEEVQDEVPADDDTCSQFELAQSFRITYKIADETAVTLKKDYIQSLCADSLCTRVAAGLSNTTVQLFNISAECGLSHYSTEEIPGARLASDSGKQAICGVRFLDETPNLLLVGTTNGLVRLFDLRIAVAREQALFENADTATNKNAVNNISCFDRNANGRVLCTGTEQHLNEAFIIFYDVRKRQQLGAYFESHQDDITSVCFHAQNPDLLCSGSTDGLINVYNIKEATEEDALDTTINTESSVHKLNWHKNDDKDLISCLTHTNDFKVYECSEGDLVAEFERSKITTALKRTSPANCNLVNSYNMEDGNIGLLSGTYCHKGEVMRSLFFQKKQLLPLANFEGNKQIVHESVYNTKNNTMITGGESGIISLWKPQTPIATASSDSKKLKTKSKQKSSSKMPY